MVNASICEIVQITPTGLLADFARPERIGHARDAGRQLDAARLARPLRGVRQPAQCFPAIK
jgi:hypothetical protein